MLGDFAAEEADTIAWFEYESNTMPMTSMTRQIAVATIVVLHLIADLVVIPVAYRYKLVEQLSTGLFILFGLLLGQGCLVAAYLAWGTDQWVRRWLKACFLMVLVWAAITAGARSTGDSFEIGSIEQLLATVTAMSFLFASIPYWALRAVCRSRFERVEDALRLAVQSKPQFRIRDLMLGTFGAALLLTILRSLIGRAVWNSTWSIPVSDWAVVSAWMALWAMLSVIVAVPMAWACLGKHEPVRRIIVVGVYAAIMAICEWVALRAFGNFRQESLFIAGLNFGVFCEVTVCSLLLRTFGYRLQLYAPRCAA